MILSLFVIFLAQNFSNMNIKADNASATQLPLPSLSPVPSQSQIPTPSFTPPPSSTPTQSFEIILMNPLHSNTVNPAFSLIAIISLTISGTVSVIYIIFYIIPFIREDLSPLL